VTDTWFLAARHRIGIERAKRRRRGVKTPELDRADELISEKLAGKRKDPGETKRRIQALESEHRERIKELRKRGKGRKKGGRPSVLTVSGGALETNRSRH
jgi:hypothetical protein